MTSDPKERLDRLKRIVKLVEHRGVADAVVKAADLSWLIAEREGLEREVERLRLALKPFAVRTVDFQGQVRFVGKVPDRADYARARNALRALLHPTVPVETDFVDQDAADARSMSPEALEDALTEAYTPTLIAFDDPPRIEYVNADAPHISRRIDERFDLLLDMNTREPIGFSLYGNWTSALSSVPPSQRTEKPTITSNPVSPDAGSWTCVSPAAYQSRQEEG